MRQLFIFFIILIFNSCNRELIENQNEKIESYLIQINELKSEVNNLSIQLNEIRIEFEKIKEQNSILNSEIDIVKSNNEELSNNFNSLSSEFENLRNQLIELDSINDSQIKLIRILEENYDNLVTSYFALENSNESLLKIIESLQEEHQILIKKYDELIDNNDELTRLTSSLVDNYSQLQSNFNDLESQNNTLVDLINSLKEQIAILNENMSGNSIEVNQTDSSSSEDSSNDSSSSEDSSNDNSSSEDSSNDNSSSEDSSNDSSSSEDSSNDNSSSEDSSNDNSSSEESTKSYEVIINIIGNGNTSVNSGTFIEGQQITITASSFEDSRFVNWTGDLNSTSESIVLNVNSNITINANFELVPIYNLTVTTNEGGRVSIESGSYQEGESVTIIATPDNGYYFSNWSGDSSSSSSEITILINSDIELTALFAERNTVSVNVINDNGGVINFTGSFGSSGSVNSNTTQIITLFENETIEFTVLPDFGWFLNSWGGDFSGNEISKTITLNPNFNVISTEYRESPIYALIVEVQNGGNVERTSRLSNVTILGGQTSTIRGYYSNEEITLKAIPDSGKTFVGWKCTSGCSGNTFGSNETITLTIQDSDIRVVAEFQ